MSRRKVATYAEENSDIRLSAADAEILQFTYTRYPDV